MHVPGLTGFAQKFGPVLNYVRLTARPVEINQVRIDQGATDALIGCAAVVSAAPKASPTYRLGMQSVVNAAEMPTGDIVRLRNPSLDIDQRLAAISCVAGPDDTRAFDANRAAERRLTPPT